MPAGTLTCSRGGEEAGEQDDMSEVIEVSGVYDDGSCDAQVHLLLMSFLDLCLQYLLLRALS